MHVSGEIWINLLEIVERDDVVQLIEENHGVGGYGHIIKGKMHHKLKCIDHTPEEL